MDELRGTILSQGLVIIGMAALIFGRLEGQNDATTQVFGTDPYIIFAVVVIVAAIVLIGRAFQGLD